MNITTFFFTIRKTFYFKLGYLYNSHYTNLLQINLFGLKKGFMDINPFSFMPVF